MGNRRICGTGRTVIWNDRTIGILRRMYPTFTSGDIADVIGCSDTTVRNKAHELGLTKDPSFNQFEYVGRYTGKRDPNKKHERDYERERERIRTYNQEHSDKRREYARLYYQAHREKLLEKAKERHRNIIRNYDRK